MLLCVTITLVSWSHKFYVGIFQIEHNAGKQRLEITCRIFADDLDKALEKKFNGSFHFSDGKADASETAKLQQYLKEKFSVKCDGVATNLEFKSTELENGVLLIYFTANKVKSPKTVWVKNTMLFDYMTSQQNIIQLKVGGKKQSLLLTIDENSGTAEF